MMSATRLYAQHRRWLALWPLAALLVLGWSPSASASRPMSETEYMLLPEYCRAQGNVSETNFTRSYRADLVRKWQSALGSNYNHYHHFCWGIASIARAYRPGTAYGSRAALTKSAIADITYTLERATPDFVLLPEVYTKLGEAYLLARDARSAEAAFRKAWEIKPDYWRPYVWWGQYLLHAGRSGEALAVAEEGLKHAPDVKALQELARDARAPRGKSTQ